MTSLIPRRSGISRFLLSSTLFPWILMDALNVFWSFNLFSRLGRLTHLPEIRHENFVTACVLTLSFVFMGLALGLFEREHRTRRLNFVRLGILAWGGALAMSLTILHFVFFMKIGRLSLVYGGIGALLVFLGFRFFMAWALRNKPHRFFIVGDLTSTSKELVDYSKGYGQSHLEHVDNLREQVFGGSHKTLDELSRLLDSQGSLDMVLSAHPAHRDRMTGLATFALQKGLRVLDESRFYGEIFRRYPLENLSTSWVVYAGLDVHNPIVNTFKRLFDFVFALILLVALSPLFLAIAILIKLMSRGPIFYVQIRQGRYSKPFRMVKFRTMKADEGGSAATAPGDSRITGVGKLLRPLHLDELPQLWNILWGEMSFVGPRPEALAVVENMRQALAVYEIRHMLRPGLTGWAQINQGKTQDGFEEVRLKLSYDLYYIKNYGLVFDFLIILRTIFVITRRNW